MPGRVYGISATSWQRAAKKLRAYILITHPHWDHIQGFPFFKPAFVEGNEITIIGPDARGVPLSKIIAEQMNKIYFPVKLSELQAQINFMPVKEGTVRVFGAEVLSFYVESWMSTSAPRMKSITRSFGSP